MSKKLDLTGSFKHTVSNVSDLDNNSLVGKTVVINVIIHREWKLKFETEMANYFRKLGRWDINTNKDFFILCLLNIQDHFISKYKNLIPPDENDIKFYQMPGRRNKLDHKLYPKSKETDSTMNIELDLFHYNLLLKLMNTFIKNENSNISNYSISFFFYDMIRIMKEIDKIKIYDY